MHNHLMILGVVLMQLLTYISFQKSLNKTEKHVHTLVSAQRNERKQTEDNLSRTMEHISFSIQNKIGESMIEIRDEIEFNMEVIEVINGLIKENADEPK